MIRAIRAIRAVFGSMAVIKSCCQLRMGNNRGSAVSNVELFSDESEGKYIDNHGVVGEA
jgi:hypothetical protein